MAYVSRDTAARPSPAAALSVQGVRRVYGTQVVLEDVNLQVAPGEIVSLLGHSGCGKTTLLRIIAGIERPSAGAVHLDDVAVVGPGAFVEPERRRIGLVFQDYALFPHLTILDNVLFGLSGRARAETEALAYSALAKVNLSRLSRSYPHMLSGGEQQRAALARALAPAPRLILMDEPFSNLDRRLRDDVRDQTVQLLRGTGITAVIVTHDPEEAMRLSDRIVLMREGRVVQSGPGETIYRAPASLFAARFLCDLNRLDGVCRGGAVTTPLGRFAAPGFGDGEAVIVCLRPHGLRPTPGGVPARVTARRFLGEMVEYTLAVAGLDAFLKMRLCGPLPRAVGETVEIRVDADAVLVFSAGET